MKKHFKKYVSVIGTVLLLSLSGVGFAQSVSQAVGLDVDKPAAFVSALDKWFASNDIRGEKVSIWRTAIGGSSRSSHVIVAEFDSFDDYESQTNKRVSSPEWTRFQLAASDISSVTGTSLNIERASYSGDFIDQNAIMVYSLNVTDPARYAAAFDKFAKAGNNTGSLQLIEVRAGSEGQTHLVVAGASGVAELNNTTSESRSSSAFRTFMSEARDIRKVLSVRMYTKVKSWEQ